jgi:hypothetical protein
MRAFDLRRAGGMLGSAASVVFAALVPKCPLCAAALMTAYGASGTAALEVAPFVRFAAIGVAVASVVAFLALEWRRAQRCS